MYKLDDYLNALVYLEKIDDEILKPNNYRCFPGAWYYKALSSKDKWLGIEAIIELPEFIPDENRFEIVSDNFSKTKTFKKYLDTPSVYVGGSSDYETDIGFGLFRGLVNGEVTDEKITFRPFYRYIYQENNQIKNVYKGTMLEQTEFYYFPGDVIKINLFCPEINFLQFRVELVKETCINKYKNIRKSLNLEKEKSIYLTEKIPAPGNGANLSEYKRVNAIDQYGNEGKPTKMTQARVTECQWKHVYLFREMNNRLIKVPFNESRYLKMHCMIKESFTVSTNNNCESVIIKPIN